MGLLVVEVLEYVRSRIVAGFQEGLPLVEILEKWVRVRNGRMVVIGIQVGMLVLVRTGSCGVA